MRVPLVHRLALLPLIAFALPAARAQAPASTAPSVRQQGAARALTPADLKGWKTIRGAALSNDGRWFGYVLAPNEGDGVAVLRPTSAGAKETRIDIGAPAAGASGVAMSGDARYAAVTVYPTDAAAKRARRDRRTVHNGVTVVELATGTRKHFDRVRRHAFNGERPEWIAMQMAGADAPAGGANATAAAPGSDLLLHHLGTGETINVGNVGEWNFDESGRWLAYTIDARDRMGNGLVLRDMRTGVVRALDSERALYRRLAWADSSAAVAVLRATIDSAARDTVYGVLAFADLGGTPRRIVVDGKRADFPAGLRVSGERAPRLTTDRRSVLFGLAAPRARRDSTTTAGRSSVVQPGAPGEGGARNQPNVGADDETPSLVLWHHRDPRLQSQQIVQESADRGYSYLAAYHSDGDRVVRLTDDTLRNVALAPDERFGWGSDNQPYQLAASVDGRNYSDLYVVDVRTGTRRRVMQRAVAPGTAPSPDGTRILNWGEDTQWHVVDLATGARRPITQGVPTVFADTADDHNAIVDPPQPVIGWAKDGRSVLLSDGYDVWRVPAAGAASGAVNLTGDGARTGTRYVRRVQWDPRERGIDPSKPLYLATAGEWNKREGLARVMPGRTGAERLVEEDARLAFVRARDAETFAFTRQTATAFPDWHVADARFGSAHALTDANPQQKEVAFSAGTRLVDYVNDKGHKLQGALYLPANYEPGKRYPTVVYIYERLSQNLHAYSVPNETRALNPSTYTARGYAVYMPDIRYEINDPGMSAVWSVIPGVKAAIATGIVDSTKVGLHGHSWGGYQTSFLVTQTDMFKAAVAGAPLTDLVSMYSSVYWNTGGANQAIFQSSQGRFKGNFLDHVDAYVRNSPNRHADKVKTPLVILHNDKDGAVDFNQGITFFNTLRQLGKDVILLEYVGENHGLARPANQKDYATRMREYFDHHLKGLPAPEWMTNGIPRLKMEEHLRERAAPPVERPALVP